MEKENTAIRILKAGRIFCSVMVVASIVVMMLSGFVGAYLQAVLMAVWAVMFAVYAVKVIPLMIDTEHMLIGTQKRIERMERTYG